MTDTGFANASDLGETKLFEQAGSPLAVAKDGYEGMLDGKLDVVSGLTLGQRIMLAAMPFIPKRMVLKQVRLLQET